jgi:hypothetical protein
MFNKKNCINKIYPTTFAAWAIAADMVMGSVLKTEAAAAAAAIGPPPLKNNGLEYFWSVNQSWCQQRATKFSLHLLTYTNSIYYCR